MRNGVQQDVKMVLVIGIDEDVSYIDTVENFAADHGAAISALPNGITLRIYERGIRHPLIANNNVLDGGPMPWPEGETIIASLDSLIAAKKARLAAAEANKKTDLDMGRNIYDVITQ